MANHKRGMVQERGGGGRGRGVGIVGRTSEGKGDRHQKKKDQTVGRRVEKGSQKKGRGENRRTSPTTGERERGLGRELQKKKIKVVAQKKSSRGVSTRGEKERTRREKGGQDKPFETRRPPRRNAHHCPGDCQLSGQ